MPQPFDEQLRRAFDSLADQLRAAVDDHAAATLAPLASAVVEAERQAAERAAADAAATTEREVTARLQAAFAEREAQVREQAHARGHEDGLQEARAESAAIQEAHEAVAQAAAESAAIAAAQAAVQAAAHSEQAAMLAAQAQVGSELSARARAAQERLLRAVRALDGTRSLSQTLDALAAAAQAEAEGVGVFLVRGELLRAWGEAGFEALTGTPAEVPLSAAGVAADAVRAGSPQRDASGEGRPAFAGPFNSGAFVAVPLAMNGQVIAVLCGDQPSATDAGESLASTFEVLARHAARVLESLTALRLAQLGAPAASAGVAPLQP